MLPNEKATPYTIAACSPKNLAQAVGTSEKWAPSAQIIMQTHIMNKGSLALTRTKVNPKAT